MTPTERERRAIEREKAANEREAKADARAAQYEADTRALRQRVDAIPTRIEERVDCVDRARRIAPGLAWRGRTNEEIRRDALAAVGVDVNGRSDAYVAAAFDARTEGRDAC